MHYKNIGTGQKQLLGPYVPESNKRRPWPRTSSLAPPPPISIAVALLPSAGRSLAPSVPALPLHVQDGDVPECSCMCGENRERLFLDLTMCERGLRKVLLL